MTRGLGRLAGPLRRVPSWAWLPVFYALVVLWTYRDLWHQHGVATGFGWDVVDTHGPDLEFMARELREGRFSLWNPWDKGGYAVYADPIVCRYYPFLWPFVAWGAAFGASWWLIQIAVLGHHVAMALCMHGFLRRRQLATRAAMIGGIGLVASAPVLIHKASNILWPLTWVPLVWLAIDAAVARPSWRRGAAVAAAYALCATAGSPPGLFYASLLIAPYGLWRVARVRPPWRAFAGCAAVAAVLAALVVAVVALPTSALVAASARDRWASGDAFALSLSFGWGGVLRGAFAHAAGYFEMYVGAAVALLAVCAVQRRRDAGTPRLFVGLAIAAFALVAGSTLPVLPWLVHHAPGFALMRIPGRYKLLAAWSLAAAAGYGADALDGTRPRAMAITAIAGLAASVAAVAASSADHFRPAWWSIVAMAVPCALVAGAAYLPRLRGAAVWGLVIAVLLDAPSFTHTPTALPAADPRQLHARDEERLARLDGVRDRFRLYDEFVLGERVGQRRAVRELRGYPAVDPLLHRRYVGVLDAVKRDPAILAELNVRWVVQGPHFRFGTGENRVPPLAGHPAFAARGDGVFEARHPAPLVAWYGAVTEVARPDEVLPAMRAIADAGADAGARQRAVVERDAIAQLPALASLTGAAPGSAPGALVAYEPDAIAVTVDAPRAGLVVLNELAFPGWTVEVDGEPALPLRANDVMRAVYVGPGHHAIRWRFEPPHVRALIAGYLLALAVMLAAAIAPRAIRRAGAAAARTPAPAAPAPARPTVRPGRRRSSRPTRGCS